MASFATCSMNQCFCNMTFSSLQQETMQEYFGPAMDKATTDMLMNWGPILGICCTPVAIWVSSTPAGLKRTLWCGILLTLSGAIVRLLPIVVRETSGREAAAKGAWAYACYHVGQALVAAAGPFLMGAVTLLSVLWFAESERTFATAVAQVSNGIGATVVYLNPLWLVRSPAAVPNMFYFSLAVAVLPFASALLLLPERPARFPSAAAEAMASLPTGGRAEEETCSSNACRRLSNRSFVVLLFAFGIWDGAMIGWGSLFQTMLGPIGIEESVVAWMGFASGLAANIAGIAAGGAIDLCFRRRLKAGILFGGCGYLACLAWFALSLSSESPALRSTWSLAGALTLAGAFQGVLEPLCYELAAELVYPIKESTSAGLIVLALNAAAGVMIGANAFLDVAGMNGLIIAASILLLLSIGFGVREEYKRPANSLADMNAALRP